MKKLILAIMPFLLNMCSTNKYDISAYSILVKEEINMSVGEIIEYKVYSRGFSNDNFVTIDDNSVIKLISDGSYKFEALKIGSTNVNFYILDERSSDVFYPSYTISINVI